MTTLQETLKTMMIENAKRDMAAGGILALRTAADTLEKHPTLDPVILLRQLAAKIDEQGL
jgi:hypothetical protein